MDKDMKAERIKKMGFDDEDVMNMNRHELRRWRKLNRKVKK